MSSRVPVPLLNLKRQFETMRSEVLTEVASVFDSQLFILSGQVAAFESEIAEFLGAGEAVGMSSGTDALLAALMAAGVAPGDEVIVPAFSFFATAGEVSRLGARPVFADIEPTTFNLDPEDFTARITGRTRAVIPVHLYGQCADMGPILASARKAGVAVIEDACQAIGATYRGRSAGTLGDIGAFSFFPTKNLGAAGDAGLAATGDPETGRRLRRLRVHGMEPKYHHEEIGGNFRLDELQAAVLRVKLRRLPTWNRRRREIAAIYDEKLSALESRGRLGLPQEAHGCEHVFHQFVIRVGDRDGVRKRLADRGIGSEVYYPVPLHLQPCFASLGAKPGDLPEAERAAREVLALPVWPEMTAEEIEAVVQAVSEAVS